MLWQDAPHVAFADLKSEEAQARLSVCEPISGLQEVTRVGGVERYPAVVIIWCVCHMRPDYF